VSDFAYQGSLFASTTGGFDRSYSAIERTHLEHSAWVDRQSGWAANPNELFAIVLDSLEWREGIERVRGMEVPRPRLVASFGAGDLPDELKVISEMSGSLSDRYGKKLERVTCNLYRDGRDSVAWHGDRIARDREEATVAILSLGEPRPFRIRPKGGGRSIGWPAGHGDLIVMGGSCQRTHDHSIPKVAKAGPRIAVMFRHSYD
jgi:hypothetical protein